MNTESSIHPEQPESNQTEPTALDERLKQAEEILARLTEEKERQKRLAELEKQIEEVKAGDRPKPVYTPPVIETYKFSQLPSDYEDVKRFLRKHLEDQMKAHEIQLQPKQGRWVGNEWKLDTAVAALFRLYVFYKEEAPKLGAWASKSKQPMHETAARQALGSIHRKLKMPFEI